MSGNLFTGAGYFLRGLKMLSEPGLRRFVIVPLMANVMLFSLMGWLLFEMISDFYDAALLTVPEWLQFLSWIITPLLWLVGGLMTGYVSTFAVDVLDDFLARQLPGVQSVAGEGYATGRRGSARSARTGRGR